MWKLLYPHLLVGNVVELTPERLKTLGVEYLLLDVDCTLKRYSLQEPEPDVSAWLESLKDSNFKLCLLSNGVEKRIERFAKLVDLPFVAKACKPLPCGCRRAITARGFDPAKTAIIGDQIFADVLAGRLAGLRAICVSPIAPEEEHWFTRIKRPFERLVLRSFRRKFPDGVWKE